MSQLCAVDMPTRARPPSVLREGDVLRRARRAFDEVPAKITLRTEMERIVAKEVVGMGDSGAQEILQYRGELPLSLRKNRVVYFVTPTYKRASQVVDLLRVSQMLQLATLTHQVGLVYWIVVEDAVSCTERIRDMLLQSALPFAHIAVPSNKTSPCRGMQQRNAALRVIRRVGAEGVVYFGDDDNAYDARLITELSLTKGVGIFSVAFVGGGAYERCEVAKGRVVAMHSSWVEGRRRRFPMDMAGFAFSTGLLLRKRPAFPEGTQCPRWFSETVFFEQLVGGWEDLEPLAANCTSILAWHVKTSGATTREVDGDKAHHILKNLL